MVIYVLMGIISLIFIIIAWVKWFRMTSDINRMSRLMEEWMRRNGVELSKDVSVPESNGNVEPVESSTRDMILGIIVVVAILSIIFILTELF